MPPPSLIRSKYALMPSASSAYLPPTGLVLAVMTLTWISSSVTPTSSIGTFLVRSDAVVGVVDPPAPVVGAALSSSSSEFPHAANSSVRARPSVTSFEPRIGPPGLTGSEEVSRHERQVSRPNNSHIGTFG